MARRKMQKMTENVKKNDKKNRFFAQGIHAVPVILCPRQAWMRRATAGSAAVSCGIAGHFGLRLCARVSASQDQTGDKGRRRSQGTFFQPNPTTHPHGPHHQTQTAKTKSCLHGGF